MGMSADRLRRLIVLLAVAFGLASVAACAADTGDDADDGDDAEEVSEDELRARATVFGFGAPSAYASPSSGGPTVDARFDELVRGRGMKTVRLIVGMDSLADAGYVGQLQGFVEAALARGLEPYITFTAQKNAPESGASAYGRVLVHLYADVLGRRVTHFSSLNEPDLGPTYVAPATAADYYVAGEKALHSACAHCTFAAGEFAAVHGVGKYVHDFQARLAARAKHDHAFRKPTVWTIHAYQDVTLGTHHVRDFEAKLRAEGWKGFEVWVTEAGTLIKQSTALAGKKGAQRAAAKRFLALARVPTVKRVYYYELRAIGSENPVNGWDSALLDWNGNPRPAFCVIAGRPTSECNGWTTPYRCDPVSEEVYANACGGADRAHFREDPRPIPRVSWDPRPFCCGAAR